MEAAQTDDFSEWITSGWLLAGTAVLTGIVAYFAYRRIARRKTYPPEVVVLHKYGTCVTTPCISPFSIKLATYMRIAKIPYETECGLQKSPKGQVPWLSHKGAVISDSQFCIEYLDKEFKVDLNMGMSERDKAIARATRIMVEDNLYWYLLLERGVYASNPKWIADLSVPWLVWFLIFKPTSTKKAKLHGMGRHTKEEVNNIAIANVTALSIQLGDQEFLFGDHPVEVDCAVFGQLAPIYYSLYGSAVSNYIKDELPTLVSYCERMKALTWPDWEECLTKPRK